MDESKKNPIGLFVYRNIVSCFFQDHSLGVVTSIWGPQKESACMDGSNTEVTCDEEKHVFCSIKGTNLIEKNVIYVIKSKFDIFSWFLTVCDDDEILVGDACVYNSKSTGDIQTKPECEPYKNSYSEHPFILPDSAAVYSKAAYLLQTKVLIL